jgi:hypothetical protein
MVMTLGREEGRTYHDQLNECESVEHNHTVCS